MSEVTFEPFQRVLVRDFDHNEWHINFFERKCGEYFLCFSGNWKQCLPYTEETAHLLGTTDSPTPPEPEFKWGDHVEVRDDEDQPWRKGVFINKYINDKYISYYCSIEPSGSCCWRYCRHAEW